MQTYDILMLVVLAATTIFGAIKGFAWQLASLGSIVASYFIAYAFRGDVAKMINAEPPWNVFLAMLLLYFGSSFVIWMVFRLVSSSIDKVRLREFDRHLGAGFGLLKGMLLCLLITMFAMSLLGAAQQQRIANSKSGLYISRALANAGGILPAEIKQVVGPYLTNVEQKLNENQTPGANYPFSENAAKIDTTIKDAFGRVSETFNEVQEKVGNAAKQYSQTKEQLNQMSEQFGGIAEQANQAGRWLNENVPLPTSQQNAQQPYGTQLPPNQAAAPNNYPQPGAILPPGLPSQQPPQPQSPSSNYAAPVFVPIQQNNGGNFGTY